MASQYSKFLSRYAHPGFVTADDIDAALPADAGGDQYKFAMLVADLCVLNSTPSLPRLYITRIAPYSVILGDGHGYPLFTVKVVGGQYQVTSLRDYRFKKRGNNRNIIHSVKPQYIVKQMKTEAAKVMNHPAFVWANDLHTGVYQGVTSAVGDIAKKARQSANYVTDAAVLCELMQVIRGESSLMTLSHQARSFADIYYEGTKKIVDDRANVSNIFAQNFVNKTFYSIVSFGSYGFGVCTIGIKPTATMNGMSSNAHHHVDIHSHYRMFKSLQKFQELAPELYNDVFLQMAMNKNAMMGMGEHAPGKAVRFLDSLPDVNADKDFASMMPIDDYYNESLNAFGWWNSSVSIKVPCFYFMEKVS